MQKGICCGNDDGNDRHHKQASQRQSEVVASRINQDVPAVFGIGSQAAGDPRAGNNQKFHGKRYDNHHVDRRLRTFGCATGEDPLILICVSQHQQKDGQNIIDKLRRRVDARQTHVRSSSVGEKASLNPRPSPCLEPVNRKSDHHGQHDDAAGDQIHPCQAHQAGQGRIADNEGCGDHGCGGRVQDRFVTHDHFQHGTPRVELITHDNHVGDDQRQQRQITSHGAKTTCDNFGHRVRFDIADSGRD